MNPLDTMYDTVTLSAMTDTDTITISADDALSLDITDTSTVTIDNSTCDASFLDDFTWSDALSAPQEIQVGKTRITSEVAEKMIALIDMIEGLDDQEQLKELFNTQLSMNKIRGSNGNS